MSKDYLSPFQLLASTVERVSFDASGHSAESGSVSLSIGHFFDDDELREDGVWAIKGGITVECEWEDKNGDLACRATCDIRGAVSVFESAFADGFPENEKARLLRANLVSLLYGEARGLCEMLSARSSVGKKILPAIDPFEYLEEE